MSDAELTNLLLDIHHALNPNNPTTPAAFSNAMYILKGAIQPAHLQVAEKQAFERGRIAEAKTCAEAKRHAKGYTEEQLQAAVREALQKMRTSPELDLDEYANAGVSSEMLNAQEHGEANIATNVIEYLDRELQQLNQGEK